MKRMEADVAVVIHVLAVVMETALVTAADALAPVQEQDANICNTFVKCPNGA